MKLTKKLIQEFNQPEAIITISTYPRQGHTYDPQAKAAAPFTKHKLKQLKHTYPDRKLIVLADIIDKPRTYIEDGVLVIRCWQRNNRLVWFQIQKQVNLFPEATFLLIEHEFGIFGLKHTITAQFPLFLAYNRLVGKNITLSLHQVIFDLRKLSGHLQLSPTSPLFKLYNPFIQANYLLFGLLAHTLTVTEDKLKGKLGRLVNKEKIQVDHLIHPTSKKLPKTQARKELNLNKNTTYLLYLGYVTWYKGADWLIDTFTEIKKDLAKKNVKLIIAGGQSSSLEIDQKYLNWYNQVKQKADNDPNIIFTGVLPEKELSKYSAAADLMIMPYRLMMSGSGPFTIAQETNTPTIFSNNLRPLIGSRDVKAALNHAQLPSDSLFFNMNNESLKEQVNNILNKPNLLKKLKQFMGYLSSQRQLTNPSKLTFNSNKFPFPQSIPSTA